MSDEEQEVVVKKKESEIKPRRRPKKIIIPHRTPSVVIPGRKIVYTTADKLTCAECDCFPKEEPYLKNRKRNECQKSPPTLYELSARVVDRFELPDAFKWSVEDVMDWMENIIGLPQYKECIYDNHINGMRLLMLEDPSKLTMINIHDFQHIKRIVARIRQDYGMDFIRFARSVNLPPRRLPVHLTWFYSRTGPTWGIRKNWSTTDVLRHMKILDPPPTQMDHWDLVWYSKPDFPKTMFARVPQIRTELIIPIYKKPHEVCTEYMVPRKFKVQTSILDRPQMIWMQKQPQLSPIPKKKKKKKEKKKIEFLIKPESRLQPKKIVLEGLKGKDLVLARRLMPKPKFFS